MAAASAATSKPESKLINQGSYGCIYYPALPFKLQQKIRKHNETTNEADTKRKMYVSKLQKLNFHSEFEDYIGRKIQQIPSYDVFFVPVLSTYNIDLATIKQTYVTECEAIRKYTKRPNKTVTTSHTSHTSDYKMLNKKFINQKMKYINGLYLNRYLLGVVTKPAKNKNQKYDQHDSESSDDEANANANANDANANDAAADNESMIHKTLRKDERQIKKYRSEFKRDEIESSYHLMSIAFDLYERIIDSIQLLVAYKIVHFDLKENNILIEKKQQLPYIIDFGLSIDVERLLQHKWSDKYETSHKDTKNHSNMRDHHTIDSNVLYSLDSSKIFKDNYLWKQHFYVHAPDYFLWPLEVHLITYLINENDTLTEESLYKICFLYISNNRAIEYMSSGFKKRMFEMSIATFSRFIGRPREDVLNELLKYWDKWDMYAINIMFLRIMYELIFNIENVTYDDKSSVDTFTSALSEKQTQSESESETNSKKSLNEQRQHKLDPHYSSDTKIEFKSKYKVKLKQKYNSYKIMNTIQVMLRNIHPNPDKRMTPQETKVFFVSIFYEC